MNDALSPNQEHLITLSSFEGPLDLLLYLIKKDELDIYNIPIASVTNQYIDSIKKMEQLNLEVAGEFFVMASTLMYIKSRYLLPKKDRDNASFVEEEDDPRWELVEKLIEYKKFKNLATDIQGLIEKTNDYHPRYISDRTHHLQQKPLKPVDRVEIWNVFNNVLSRLSDKITQGQINEESVTVSERMSFILSKLNVEINK